LTRGEKIFILQYITNSNDGLPLSIQHSVRTH